MAVKPAYQKTISFFIITIEKIGQINSKIEWNTVEAYFKDPYHINNIQHKNLNYEFYNTQISK